jgi:hypothetical protein
MGLIWLNSRINWTSGNTYILNAGAQSVDNVFQREAQ